MKVKHKFSFFMSKAIATKSKQMITTRVFEKTGLEIATHWSLATSFLELMTTAKFLTWRPSFSFLSPAGERMKKLISSPEKTHRPGYHSYRFCLEFFFRTMHV